MSTAIALDVDPILRLERFPPKWHRFGDKKALQTNILAHVLVGKVRTLCRDML